MHLAIASFEVGGVQFETRVVVEAGLVGLLEDLEALSKIVQNGLVGRWELFVLLLCLLLLFFRELFVLHVVDAELYKGQSFFITGYCVDEFCHSERSVSLFFQGKYFFHFILIKSTSISQIV